jgi:hypothetical protein
MEYRSNYSRRELLALSLTAALPLMQHSQKDWMSQYPLLAKYCKSLRAVKGGMFQIGSDTHADIEEIVGQIEPAGQNDGAERPAETQYMPAVHEAPTVTPATQYLPIGHVV